MIINGKHIINVIHRGKPLAVKLIKSKGVKKDV